ncbi:MAG: tRNA (adenosine(37)-N6)-threonylcarbamoyltransferase complex ATPase subunit type 1 TsaE [Chitinophagaceae bacterium]|jgi:tRNA threonylcarbamoyladenosine biosynthesis protein TsaE|nr:tRNA (adenosine(37)-N6)-threonylcarbamoyltransferase complex ATPase subunit type 1 TsaE [Chitinophagaceae bacterium]
MDAIFGLAQTEAVAAALWKEVGSKKIWAFDAPMGAGKTTFIHALCGYLGVEATVSSPTYAIVNEYAANKIPLIYHMDWYRLKDEQEALDAGIEDILNSGNHCFIEWPERASQLLPESTLYLGIEILDEQTRRIFTK